MKAALEAFWGWLGFDRVDFLTVVGLLMLYRGLSLISEAAAWTSCGAVLLLFVLIGSLRRGS